MSHPILHSFTVDRYVAEPAVKLENFPTNISKSKFFELFKAFKVSRVDVLPSNGSESSSAIVVVSNPKEAETLVNFINTKNPGGHDFKASVSPVEDWCKSKLHDISEFNFLKALSSLFQRMRFLLCLRFKKPWEENLSLSNRYQLIQIFQLMLLLKLFIRSLSSFRVPHKSTGISFSKWILEWESSID